MLWIVYLLPLVAVTVLYLIYQPVEWWWYIVLGVALDGILYAFHRLFRWYHNKSTEFHGSYATSTIYYEEWNELCSRQVPVKDKKGNTVGYRTVYYVKHHPAEWYVYYNTGECEGITCRYYEYLGRKWGTPREFHDMHRNYHTIDGDAYSYDWGGQESRCETRTTKHTYINPLKHSNSIFRHKTISRQEAATLGLFDYPPIADDDQQAILGGDPSADEQKKFCFINARYGLDHEIKVFVLIFDADTHSIDIAEQQRAYWHGGAKNEFVVCLGVKESNRVEWCHTFSWMDMPSLGVAVEGYFLQNRELRLRNFGNWLERNLNLWKRKEFRDFKYLGLALSKVQYALMVILSCALCYLAYYVTNYYDSQNYSSEYDYYYHQSSPY